MNGGSAAERAGLQAGDALIRVNNTDVYLLRHQEAQDTIRAAGGNLELTVQRYLSKPISPKPNSFVSSKSSLEDYCNIRFPNTLL